MRQIIAFIFINIALTSFSQTQLKINQTATEQYSLADEELNSVYSQILTEYKNDSIFIEKLKISQRLWIKFRDAELDMKFPEANKRLNYGSIYSMCSADYLTELTKQRTKKLKEWLEPIPEGDGCSGSIKYREPSQEVVFEKVENFKTIKLLNDFSLLKEFKTEQLIVKIISINNFPGSADGPNGEISNDIYIAVSEFDEYPNQNLFKLSNLFNPKIENIDLSDNSKPSFDMISGQSDNRNKIKIEITINEIKTCR